MREQAAEAGRGSDDIGVESWVSIRDSSEDDWKRTAEAWRELGATHLSVNTMNAGLGSPQAHIEAIERFREVVG